MADPKSEVNPTANDMPYQMSRLSGRDLYTSHKRKFAYYTDIGSVPAKNVEVLNASSKNIIDTVNNMGTRIRTTQPGMSSLVILIGEIKDSNIFTEVEKILRKKSRYFLYVPGPSSYSLLEGYHERTMFHNKGYRDYGVSYSFTRQSGVFRDIGCFWSDNNEISTVVVPGSPTLAGLSRVATIVKKADIVISHHPPAEVAVGEQSMLVSMARRIWKPKIHIYPDEGKGLILSSGGDRIIGLPSQGSGDVLRWSLGDLRKGSMNSFEGYPKMNKPTSSRRKRA